MIKYASHIKFSNYFISSNIKLSIKNYNGNKFLCLMVDIYKVVVFIKL